jgi:hypothetical protein
MNAAILMATMLLPAAQDLHTPSFTIQGEVCNVVHDI